MLSLYRCLLYLYPADYRSEYGDEMASVFREAQSEARREGLLKRGVFSVREVAGLLRGALQERSRVINGFHRFSSTRFAMRPEFRFPKVTAALMVVILAGVILTIEKATAIQASLLGTNPHLPPIQPGHFTFFPAVVVMFLAVYAAAVVGWAVLFALHRSGVHRLSETPGAAARK